MIGAEYPYPRYIALGGPPVTLKRMGSSGSPLLNRQLSFRGYKAQVIGRLPPSYIWWSTSRLHIVSHYWHVNGGPALACQWWPSIGILMLVHHWYSNTINVVEGLSDIKSLDPTKIKLLIIDNISGGKSFIKRSNHVKTTILLLTINTFRNG